MPLHGLIQSVRKIRLHLVSGAISIAHHLLALIRYLVYNGL